MVVDSKVTLDTKDDMKPSSLECIPIQVKVNGCLSSHVH